VGPEEGFCETKALVDACADGNIPAEKRKRMLWLSLQR
jgi:hypothetical protein